MKLSEIDPQILEPGWGGLLTLEEAKYIQEALEDRSNRVLRSAWGKRGKGRLPLVDIFERAFPENPQVARAECLRLQNVPYH